MRIIVLGAGIAGLTAAYALQNAGCDVLVLEREALPGGRMLTRTHQGFSWDAGAQFLLSAYRNTKRLLSDLGVPLSPHKIGATTGVVLSNRRRFYGGMRSPAAWLRHPDVSFSSKLRMLKLLPIARRYHHNLDFHRPELTAVLGCESLRSWGDRHIGADAVDYLLSLPYTALFFVPPHEVPWFVPALLVGMLPKSRFEIPCGGMGALPTALARRLSVRLGATARRVEAREDGSVRVNVEIAGRLCEVVGDGVIVATPAPVAIGLLADPDAALGKARARYLRAVRYTSSVTAAIAYSREIENRAYGLVVPTALAHPLAAIAWANKKAEAHVPRHMSLGVLMPTGSYSAQVWGLSDEEIGARLLEAADQLYPGSRASSIFVRAQRWEHAIPVPDPRLASLLASAVEAGPASASHIFTAGDAWAGIVASVEHALTSGIQAAAEVLRSFGRTVPEALRT